MPNRLKPELKILPVKKPLPEIVHPIYEIVSSKNSLGLSGYRGTR